MTEGLQSPQLPEPNPVTMQAHRRQTFWQIKFPLLVGLLLVLFAGVGVIWAAVSGGGDVSRWSDISVIWLVVPMLLLSLIMIAVTAGMVYLFGRMLPVLPRYSHLLLSYFVIVSHRVGSLSNAVVEPFLRAHSLSASVRAFKKSLRRKSG
jgi:hypothetical protein